MRLPWKRKDKADYRRARSATAAAERAVQEECSRLDEATELAARLASHRERNRFAEALKIAFGGRP